MVTDLRAVNKMIQPIGSLKSSICLPYLLPEGWLLIVIDIKDCFFLSFFFFLIFRDRVSP